MSRSWIFQLPQDSKEKMVEHFGLQKILSNNRTSIYQNSVMRVSFDTRVTRVLVYDKNDVNLLDELYKYFYGERNEC